MVRFVGALAFLALLYAGTGFVVDHLGLPIPAPVLAMLLLALGLALHGRTPVFLTEVAWFLIYIMPLMFIPPLVGLFNLRDVLARDWLILFFAVSISTLVGLLATAWLYRLLAGRPEKEGA